MKNLSIRTLIQPQKPLKRRIRLHKGLGPKPHLLRSKVNVHRELAINIEARCFTTELLGTDRLSELFPLNTLVSNITKN